MINNEKRTPAMTAAEVLRRAEAAGVAIDEDLLPELVDAMDLALTPLREVDTRTIRPVEPAVRFDATGGFPEGKGW